MKKLIKVFASIVVILVILVIAATILLGAFINPNDYKDKIEQLALEKANLQLQIEGDIGWSFYPSLGLDIGSITAAFPGDDTLASLTSAKVSVMVAPLLSGDVQMKAITVEGLDLNLIKREKGSNWQPKISTSNNTEQPSDPAEPSSKTDNSSATAFKLDIESININHANITYTDEITNSITHITGFNLTTDRLILGKPFNAQANFGVKKSQADKTSLNADVNLSARFNIDTLNQRYLLENFISQVKITTDKEIELKLAANVDANLKANTIGVTNLKVNFFNVLATGQIAVSGKNLSAINANLDIASFDLKELMQKLKLPAISTSEEQSLRSVALSTKIKGSPAQINFDALTISLDKTKIAGSANYNLDYSVIGFNLKGDALNLNPYLPPAKPGSTVVDDTSKTNTSKKTSGYSKENIIEVQALRDLNAVGKLTFKQLTYQKTNISDFEFNLNAKGGVVKIPKLNMRTYGASISNNITLDARKKNLAISISNKVNTLKIGPLLRDFASTDTLTGKLTTSSKLSARGQSVHSIVNSLNGQISFNLADGVIKGINAAQEMCETVNKISSLGGTVATTKSVDKSTPFANINGLFKLKNGVISNNNFKAALDAINATGKGTVNLPLQTLNYRVGLKIQDNLFKKSCSVNNKIQGIEWPIDCKGKFSDDPLNLCRPDLSVVKKLAEKLLKAELEKKLGISLKAKEKELKAQVKAKEKELKKKVEDKLKDKLEGALKGLF